MARRDRQRQPQASAANAGPPPASSKDAAAAPPTPSRLRRWLYRILAITLVPLIFLAALEGGLRLFGYGYPTSYWIRSDDGRACLSNSRFGWRFFGRDLNRPPIPTLVSPRKPPGVCRILVFGSSAAQGVPSPEHSFSRILQAMLNDRFPGTRFEVINTGMTAVNSHVVLPIVRDCRRLGADFYVVYMGHNEVVGPFGAGTVLGGYSPSLAIIRTSILARSTRLGQLLRDAATALAPPPDRQTWRGMEMFLGHRVAAHDPRLQHVYANFRANLQDICSEARGAGAQVILSTLVCNLKDLPPFASIHRPALAAPGLARWQDLFDRALRLEDAARHEEALALYLQARDIDPDFAELHYRLGTCHRALAQHGLALESFTRARDLDALRFRADSHINQAIRDVAAADRTGLVHLADAEKYVQGDRPENVPGQELLYEHVHLNFAGNCAVARALFRKVVELLPDSIRPAAAALPDPPSEARCARLLLFNELVQRLTDQEIDVITSRPPFSKEWHDRTLARRKSLDIPLPPDAFQRTIEQYRRATDAAPDDLLTRKTLARMLDESGLHADAIPHYRRILQLYPEWDEVRLLLGRALFLTDQPAETEAEARRVLDREPDSADAHFLLGLALLKTGRAAESERELRNTLALRPGDPSTQVGLAEALIALKRPAEAEPLFAAAASAEPRNAEYHFKLGQVRLDLGKPEAALDPLLRAAELAPDAPVPHYLIAVAAHKLNRLDLAREHYQKAIAIDPRIAGQNPALARALGFAPRPTPR